MSRTFDERTVQESRQRLSGILSEANEDAYASKEHLQRFIRELSEGLEELLVAEEELRVQGEELAASTAAIDAERERYGELFEFAPDAYLVTDSLGKIIEANSAASRMLGVPARYLDGKLLVTFVDESARRDLRGLLAQISASPQTVEERYLRMQPREGGSFVAEVRAVAGAGAGAEAGALRWMVRDMTQRLRLEEEVRFLHSEVELLRSLGQVAGLTAEPQSPEAMLDRVVDLAAQALAGCDVSVALAGSDGARYAASSGDRGKRLDRAEEAEGDGPCGAALRLGETVEVPAAEAAARWPTFGAVAREIGMASATAYPLATPGGQRGALNVYAFVELTDEARQLIPLLADEVVAALTNAELYDGARTLAAHLQRALESRGVIEQAKGVLIARQHCTDEQAFDILRRASQRLNRKLRDVAADLVAHVQTGEARAPNPGVASDPDADVDASMNKARTGARLEPAAPLPPG